MKDDRFYLISALNELNGDDMGDWEVSDKLGYTLALISTKPYEIVAWSNRVYQDLDTADWNAENVQNRVDASYEEQSGEENKRWIVVVIKLAKQQPSCDLYDKEEG